MSGGFGSNISSLRAQRQLAESVSHLTSHYTRLSSGLRINRASDDAAGLAIADGLRKDSRLFAAAVRNTNDAISALNIVDSTLSNQTGIVDRLKELATQAANGVYTTQQREALNNEYRALVREMGRLGDTTSFNGLQLLRGSRGGLSNLLFQVGVTGGEGSRISLQTADTGAISGSVRIRTTDDPDLLLYKAENGEGFLNFEELSAYYGGGLLNISVQVGGQAREVYVGLMENNTGEIYMSVYYEDASGGYSVASPGEVTILNLDYQQKRLENFRSTLDFGALGSGEVSLDFSGLQAYTDQYEQLYGAIPAASSLEFTGLDNVIRARAALDAAEARAGELSQLASRFGALQSRLESTLGVLSASRVNSEAAESRIRTADVALESAGLVRAKILQQSGAQVLALANQQPTMLLSLLL